MFFLKISLLRQHHPQHKLLTNAVISIITIVASITVIVLSIIHHALEIGAIPNVSLILIIAKFVMVTNVPLVLIIAKFVMVTNVTLILIIAKLVVAVVVIHVTAILKIAILIAQHVKLVIAIVV